MHEHTQPRVFYVHVAMYTCTFTEPLRVAWVIDAMFLKRKLVWLQCINWTLWSNLQIQMKRGFERKWSMCSNSDTFSLFFSLPVLFPLRTCLSVRLLLCLCACPPPNLPRWEDCFKDDSKVTQPNWITLNDIFLLLWRGILQQNEKNFCQKKLFENFYYLKLKTI